MERTSLWLPTLSLLMAACGEPIAAPSSGSSPGRPDAVKVWENNAAVYWNQVARDMVVANRIGAPFAIRGYAIVSVAQYNAAVEAEKGKVGSVQPSVHAAIAAASVAALAYLYPARAAALETRLNDFLAEPEWSGEEHRDAATGEAIGRDVAEQVVARAQADNFLAAWTGTVPAGPGLWFSSTPPVGALWGQARTYFLLSGSQFRPPPPPAFNSPAFLAGLAEVRQISDTRTPQQEANARFWDMPLGTVTPPGYWNQVAAQLAVQHHLSEREAAHVLALANASPASARLSCNRVTASHHQHSGAHVPHDKDFAVPPNLRRPGGRPVGRSRCRPAARRGRHLTAGPARPSGGLGRRC
jgi:hypothetical protein